MRKILLTLALLAVASAPALASHHVYRQQLFVSRIVTPYQPLVAVQAILAPAYVAPVYAAPLVGHSCYSAPAPVVAQPVQQVQTEVKTETVTQQVVQPVQSYLPLASGIGYHNPFLRTLALGVNYGHRASRQLLLVRGHRGVQQIRLVDRGRPVLFPRLATGRVAPRLSLGVAAPRLQLRK